MKLHDLHPASGAHRKRKRVGRGIAAGGGKTAGRGTKGQKARAGASIPAWFEGGQTPLQMRIPKLHGFKNRARVEYEVVNLGRINALVEAGVFEPGDLPGKGKSAASSRSGSSAPITINQEILRVAGLVSTLKKPLKVLGQGELSAALFVVADAFSRSAIRKIEAAGGSVQVLEVPREPLTALGLEPVESDPEAQPGRAAAEPDGAPAAEGEAAADLKVDDANSTAQAAEPAAEPDKPGAKAKSADEAAPARGKGEAKPASKPAARAKAQPATKPAAKAKPAASAPKPSKKTSSTDDAGKDA
jgi:large subunit ribosomal protein L15